MRLSHMLIPPSLALVADDGEPGAADAAGAEPQHAGVPRRHAQRGRVGLTVGWNDLPGSAESILTLKCRESIHFAQFATDTCVGTSF